MRISYRKTIRVGLVLFLLVPAVRNLEASDWPMYRGDAARSGYTADHLPARLRINWIRKAGNGPQPAWSGRDTRMPFDLAFQPVVSDGLVFFGSSSLCSVPAIGHEVELGSDGGFA